MRHISMQLPDHAADYPAPFIPERNLLAAILERAILDLFLDRVTRNAALRFIRADTQEAFSFIWICETLEISQEKIRDIASGKARFASEARAANEISREFYCASESSL